MKSKMEVITNTQENWILYTLTTGRTENNFDTAYFNAFRY